MALKKVTDPGVLAQLNAPQEPALQPVSDPAVLAQLNQPSAAAPALADELVGAEAPAPSLFDHLRRGIDMWKDVQAATVEPALSMASGTVATPLAGLAGLLTSGANVLGLTEKEGADTVRDVQAALTYQPRSAGGQAVNEVISYPFEKLAQGADWAGGKVAELTDSPAAGAAVNTAVQSLPALLLRGRGGRVAKAADDISNPALAAEEAAQNYVATRAPGVDWRSLPDQVKATLTDIAKDAGALDALPADAVARQLQLQSLPKPVPATAGRLSRDPVQLRNESNVAATEAGKPIRDIELAANEALLDNLDILKGKVSGKGKTAATAETPEQVGMSVQDEALRQKLELKKQEVRDLYKKAEEAGELQEAVSPKPLLDTIAKTPDKTHLKWVQQWLKNQGVSKVEKTGGITVETARTLTLKELEDLRQAAVARAMDGGTEGYYAGKIISAIDEATEGAGGEAYKAARKARREQALEFEDQAAVARLVENKSRTDRATALEDTWRKTVLGGSIDDLRKVKRSLLTGGNTKTREAGKKAWRDIRAQTIQHIKDEATKGVALNERGQPNITPAAMKRAVDSIGAEKLNEIFGPGTAKQVQKILEATRTVKTVPPALHGGSSTMGNLLAFLERGLGKVPVIGDLTVGTARFGKQLKELGASARVSREAQRSPIDRAVERLTSSRRRQQATSGLAPVVPTAQSAQSLADDLLN